MSEAREILRQLSAQRMRSEAEGRRWEAYRKLCGPPRWFMLLLVALGLASFALLFEALTAVDAGSRALIAVGRIGLVLYAVIWPPLLIYVESRRRRGLKKILEQEAPELAAQLKDERIL